METPCRERSRPAQQIDNLSPEALASKSSSPQGAQRTLSDIWTHTKKRKAQSISIDLVQDGCSEAPVDEPCSTRVEVAAAEAACRQCEDLRHSQVHPHANLHTSSEDGLVRCGSCRARNKKAALAVGTRGLRLKAYFRNRPKPTGEDLMDSSLTSSGQAQVVKDGPSLASSSNLSYPKEPMSLDLQPQQDSVSDLQSVRYMVESACQLDACDTESDCSEEATVDPWLGCDKCLRWYLVDWTLCRNWKGRPFECAAISENCVHDVETSTALVAQQGFGDARPRAGYAALPLPLGCWDIYPAQGALVWPKGTLNSLDVFAAPLHATSEDVRIQAEGVLFEAFTSKNVRDTIMKLVGLQDASVLNLRSGAKLSRKQDVDVLKSCQRWLIWEVLGENTVAAAILSKQVHTKVGPTHLRGGAVLEYIASKKEIGGKAHLLISAASEICRVLGLKELFSACDLSQDGHAFQGKSMTALAAHRRWGFEDIDQEEWRDRRFGMYTRTSNVHYMMKSIV